MKTEKNKNDGLIQSFKSNFYMLGLAYKASKSRVIWQFLERFLEHIQRIFYRVIFWEVILGFVEQGSKFVETVPFLVISVLFLLIVQTSRIYWGKVIEPAGNQKLYENLHLMMFDKATDVELECYENPDFYNKYMKAVSQVKGRAFSVLGVVSGLLVSLIALFYMLYKTIMIDPFAVVFAIFSMISTYIYKTKINRLTYELYQINVLENRKKDYVKRTIYQKDYAKEIRLSNAFTFLISYFNEAVDAVIQNTKKFGLKIGLLSCLSESINQVVVTAGAVLYASIRLVYFKNIAISEYIVLVNAIMTISGILIADAECLSKIQDNHLYINNIREFMEYKAKISESQDGKTVDRKRIVLKTENVSFAYFGQEKEVLNDINLSVSKGEKIALVGENGAGKSTLVKLLMRLYDPTNGKLTLNGTDIKEYKLKEYRKLFGTVFQDFKVFSLSVAENVLSHRMEKNEEENVINALKDSGVYDKVESLPKGINSTLTREFDPEGMVLSGGENQKIAIARVFASDCEIAIFDEPSSALDPIAEYHMYESMLKACENKAVVFISHRLSSAVLADRIYMLENGRIVETGSHEELMKKDGKYAKMFKFQANSYIGKEVS